MPFAGQRVYMTGATGFIGGVVARHLIDAGATVTALVRPRTDARELARLGATIARGDVTDPATLDLSGQQLVIHAAAWVGFGIPHHKLDLFRETNIGGTRNIIDAAEKAGVHKLVHVSSIAALGATGLEAATEDTPRADFYKSEYERTKTEAHELALRAGIPITIPMPGLVLGLNGPFDPLLKALAMGRAPFLPSDDATKGWVHVEDVAEGILAAARKGKGPYLFVDENMRATDLLVAALSEAGLPIPRRRISTRVLHGGAFAVEKAFHLFGKTPPISEELVRGLPIPMQYDSTRARKELGWRPQLIPRLARDLQILAKQPVTVTVPQAS